MIPRIALPLALAFGAGVLSLHSAPAEEVDPLVQASAYGDKTVWSYHGDGKPMPWAQFRPRDYGSSRVAFSAEGVRPVGRVPAPGVHPRIFFSPEDLPEIRRRLKEDPGGQAAWKTILAWSNAMKLTYDETADYAQPDWAKGGFRVKGRVPSLFRIGGYDPKREDYYRILAEGGRPETYAKGSPAGFFKPGATEAFRCLIDDDRAGAEKLAKATVTAIKLEQERRAREDKPGKEGEPPRPSTSRSDACALGFIYDFIFNYLTPEQKKILHDELVTLSAWADNYGTFNNAEASRSNWATFSYWVFDLMAIEGEPGFNDLKFLGLYRGWRNFYTYAFFDSGAAYEAEGKLLFGLDAAVAFDRVGWKYDLEPLTQHPLPRSYYGKFSAYAMLPTRDKFAVFDILGTMGGGFTTPQDLVVARYLFPGDKTTDFVYRALVGDDYRTLPSELHFHWHQAITSAIFATAYSPEVDPEKLELGLTFFCGQRALMMTRSSWDKNATMLTMQVRGASGGHPYPDRNGIMMSGQGRTWVTIPGKDIGSWAMNTVSIDGAGQNASTPARVVDFVDAPTATFLTGDSKYSWDWVWSTAPKTTAGTEVRREDVDRSNIQTGLAWKPVEQSFNDFAWTKSEQEIYRRPLKYNASWIAPDGVYNPYIRQVNTPVLRSFRSAGIIRGPRPYVLVVDDIQRDNLPARYDWNLTLPGDLVRVPGAEKAAAAGDVILAGKDSVDAEGNLTAGEPALLLRVVNADGRRQPVVVGPREKQNLLTISTVAESPNFKVLLHAFRGGEPLPTTQWNAARDTLAVSFPDQSDLIRFKPAASGRTEIAIDRGGKNLLTLNRAVETLNDPETDALTGALRTIPERLNALRAAKFQAEQLPGFVAGWRFNGVKDGAFPPVAGSAEGTPGVPVGDAQPVPGPGGNSVALFRNAVTLPMPFADRLSGNFTFTFWVKTAADDSGTILASNAHMGLTFDLVQSRMRFNALKTWALGGSLASSMLTGWTHFAVTSDGTTLSLYRNGRLLMAVPIEGRKTAWGRDLVLGSDKNACAFTDIYFFDASLPASTVDALYLSGRTSPGQLAGKPPAPRAP